MDLRHAVRIWRARWILTSMLLILAIVGGAAAVKKMPRYYQSTSSVVLLASRAASVQNGGNPFLSFGPSLTLTADAVSREMMAPAAARQLAARGFTASYTVGLPSYTTTTTGSVLLVTVTGSDAAEVQLTLQAVTAEISTQLAQLQHGLQAASQERTATLAFSPQPTLSVSQTARPLVGAGALLLVICLGIPIVVDGLVTRRRLRRRSVLPDSPALPEDWALLDIPASPYPSAFAEEPTIPGEPTSPEEPTLLGELVFPRGATGSADQQVGDGPTQGDADQQVGDGPAQGEPRLPSSSGSPARNGGSSRHARHLGPTGRQADLGDVSRP